MDSGSKSRRRKSTNWPTNGLESLPCEVALDILSRLPITSLTRCRFVSRSWQNLTSDHDLINLHLSRTAKNNKCLIFHPSFSFGNQLHFVEFSDHSYKEKVKKNSNAFPTPLPKAELKVVGSCNGLICLSYSINHDVLQICNPFTRSYKKLLPPSMQLLDQRVLAGFGFHPLTNEYKVVRIIYYQNVHDRYSHSVPVHSESEVQVYSMDSNNWRLIGKRYLIRLNAGHQNFYWLMAGFTGYVDLIMVGSIEEKLSHLTLLMSFSERYQHLNGVG